MSTSNGKSVLLLVDLQNDFCHPDGTAAKRGKNVHVFRETLLRTKNLLDAARNNSIPVIHAISEHSEWTASPTQKERYGRAGSKSGLSYCEPGSWGAEFFQPFIPEHGEKIVIKHRYSAFLYTDLELILRRSGVTELVISGAYTNVCLDSTARDGYMRDFHVIVPADCAVSDHQRHHDYALALLDGTFADVVHSDDIKRQWERSR
ncbi:cysteine hydrolase family protein [Virgibacillus kimchii]